LELSGGVGLKVLVFDLGGTLMQYVGMPHSWVDFYYQGFEAMIQKYAWNVSKEAVEKSIQILKGFNPRVHYREIEYSAEYIFAKALEHWHIDTPIADCIDTFWGGLRLSAEIYADTFDVLPMLKEKGYVIATLTDLPNAMPDEVFQRDISDLIDHFDYYVSSSVAGYRKPHIKGLQMISDKYGVPVTELVFVGDEEKDRETAFRANCQFVHIKRKDTPIGSISNLYELFEMLM
jgi:putative hydrolase of the HAD superfamily